VQRDDSFRSRCFLRKLQSPRPNAEPPMFRRHVKLVNKRVAAAVLKAENEGQNQITDELAIEL